jgi:hypothetical protein
MKAQAYIIIVIREISYIKTERTEWTMAPRNTYVGTTERFGQVLDLHSKMTSYNEEEGTATYLLYFEDEEGNVVHSGMDEFKGNLISRI